MDASLLALAKSILFKLGFPETYLGDFYVIFAARPRLSGDLSLKCHEIYFFTSSTRVETKRLSSSSRWQS